MSLAKNWCFTLNNYTEEEEQKIQKTECTFIIYGHEVAPETETQHLQGYVQFKKKVRMTAIKKIDGYERAHLELSKGTPEQNIQYCTKSDKDGYFKNGEPVKPRKRTDLDSIKKSILTEGKTVYDIVDDIHNVQQLKFSESLMKYQKPYKRTQPPHIICIWGESGIGKSRISYEYDEDVWLSPESLQYWHGYHGQKTVLFDEFRGSFCPYNTMLRFTDRYPVQVRVLYGFEWLRADVIFITSCKPPEEWYDTLEDIEQLKRRIGLTIHMKSKNDYEDVRRRVYEYLNKPLPHPVNVDEDKPIKKIIKKVPSEMNKDIDEGKIILNF